MENEYSHLEHLVNDVTNLDTARMTLRWALERLHSLEKSNAELKRDFAAAQAAREQAEQKVRTVGQSMESRAKALDEQEGFHKKMEATLDLLSGGKIDVTHLVRKEAQLDSLRRELEEDYQRRFENLDKTQAQISQRWNQRLLDVESRYAERLSESQTHYDGLRQGLEKEYQARLARLEESFRGREKELLERVNSLEESAELHDNAVEEKRVVLETELSGKKTELERNYQKLKTVLETNFDARVRTMEDEHAKRMKSLGATWEAERNRLLEEQRVRENQFRSAQGRIREIEEALAQQQARHHMELLERIHEGESAFRDREKQLQEELRNREVEVVRMKDESVRRDAAWAEKLRKMEHEVIWKKVAELDSMYREREAEFRSKEDEIRATYEELFHKRVVEHDAEAKAMREGFDKERRHLKTEITAREATILEVNAEADRVAQEAIKATSGLKTKLEAARRDMESEFSDRESWLKDELKNREAEMASMKDESVRRDAVWAEKLRKMEHEVIWKKVAELDAMYREREAEFRSKEDEIRATYEELFHKRVVEHEAEAKAMREGFDKERRHLKTEITAREATILEVSTEADKVAQEAIKETSGLKTKLEAARRDMESEFSDRESWLKDELKNREAEMASMKDESVRRDAAWGEKLRKMEHEVIWKKVAELDSKYQERRIELENRSIAVRAQAEAEIRKLKDGFEINLSSKRAELENEYAVSVSSLEASYNKSRENSTREHTNKINALAAEQARRQKLYEGSWQAERNRFESEIADSRKVFESAQAELAGTVTRIQKLEENLVKKDADHDRQTLELRRKYESVLKDRIRKEVDANVTGLNKDLEIMTVKMKILGKIVKEKENMINGLKNENSARDSEWSEKLRNFEHDIISEKVRKLEEEYHKHRIELEIQAQKERAQMKKDLEKLRKLDPER